ncbi:MAG TPA: glycosyltransferase family 87 protein [Tepidisphaeraceae bacterium]|jgi:hypothetical protein|nr:glycosyltransferase family 87 protein [Tepidisphaeraceae bacterium]
MPLSARSFNYLCIAFVALLFAAFILLHIWKDKERHDFGQFYMGGTMAHTGDWDSLYPVPLPKANVNPGWSYGSTEKPHYHELTVERGVGRTFRFIQLPPNAILYSWMAHLSYQNAYRVWHIVMAIFVVLTAAEAGAIYLKMSGERESYIAGLVTLLVGCSPLMIYTQSVSNTGPLLSACFGAAVLGLLGPEKLGLSPAIGMVVGGFTKYAPAVILPLVISMRRWRTLAWSVGLAVVIALATICVTGTGVWVEFWKVIWPPLQKSSNEEACQSLWGFLSRVLHQFPLHHPAVLGIKIGQYFVLVVILLTLVKRKEFWNVPEHVAAAAAALMAWLLIFAPIAWQFYHCMLTPLWAWLVWEAIRGKTGMRIAVAAGILLTIAPSPGSLWGKFPEPIASRQLFSAVVILGIALWRLGCPCCGIRNDSVIGGVADGVGQMG